MGKKLAPNLFPLSDFSGVVGNGLVCVLVYQNRKMRTAMNFFLVNLAICDGIICLFNIPTTLVYNEYTQVWPFGLAFCKILPGKFLIFLAMITSSYVICVSKICLVRDGPLDI